MGTASRASDGRRTPLFAGIPRRSARTLPAPPRRRRLRPARREGTSVKAKTRAGRDGEAIPRRGCQLPGGAEELRPREPVRGRRRDDRTERTRRARENGQGGDLEAAPRARAAVLPEGGREPLPKLQGGGEGVLGVDQERRRAPREHRGARPSGRGLSVETAAGTYGGESPERETRVGCTKARRKQTVLCSPK